MQATCFIYIVHISIVSIATLFIFSLMVQFYSDMDLALAANEFIHYLAGVCTYWLIISESLIHRQSHKQCWLLLEHIDRRFSFQSNVRYHCYALKFIQFFSTTLVMLAIRMILKFVDSKIDVIYNILFKMCQIRLFYYIFCLEVIGVQFKMIENEIHSTEHLVKVRKLRFLPIQKSVCLFALHRLKWIREYFHCVRKMIVN